MFPGRFGGPMDSSNYRHRMLHKLARELDLPKLTFQVIRRTIATLGKTKGHVKDIQGMMRHSKASTTTDVYMQSLEPEVRMAINSIYSELCMGLRSTYRDENHIELQGFTIELAWNGEGRGNSGSVEAVSEFGLGCVFEPICVAPSIPVGRLVARDGV